MRLASWRHGLLYPHWTASANFGAGEPRFVFYPPLTWMLGAALGIVLPWKLCTHRTDVSVPRRNRSCHARPGPPGTSAQASATLAGCIAIFSGYALFTAYERSAFAELAGGVLVSADAHARPARSRKEPVRFDRCALLAVRRVFDGSVLLPDPGGCRRVALQRSSRRDALLHAGGGRVDRRPASHSWVPVLRAGIAVALGIGLAAFYLVPAAWEQRWVAIRQATDDPGLLIENSWLFARHAEPTSPPARCRVAPRFVHRGAHDRDHSDWRPHYAAAAKPPCRDHLVDPPRFHSSRRSASAASRFAASVESLS